MKKYKLYFIFLCLLCLSLTLSACSPSRSNLLEQFASQKEGEIILYIVGNSDYAYEVNKVHNSEPTLLKKISSVIIHTTKEEKEKWRKLGIEEFPHIMILDTQEIIFHIEDPEELREFAKSLTNQTNDQNVEIYQQEDKDIDLKNMFSKWDRGEITDSEGLRIMESFVGYVHQDPDMLSEDILSFSNYFSIFASDDFRIIQYIENPELYGASGRESYHIVIYDGLVEMIDNKGSMRIDEIIKQDEHRFYIFATDYRVSNITGIQIFNVAIEDRKIKVTPAINKSELAYPFNYDDLNHTLYYEDGHIYFSEIQNNGSEVLITVGDEEFLLQLGTDGQYFLL